MAEALQGFFDRLLTRVPGLLAAIVTDRDGVIVVKATTSANPQATLQAGYLASFTAAIEQASKIGLQKNTVVACSYESYQTVHFNHLPIILTFIASSEANIGVLLSLEDELAKVIEPIASNFRSRAAELDL
ncbi:hypothetical protein CAOG_02109 [Capsaspora owczarzaki ATCC 30864]|uniref:Uncharacterized protein n=1 Tax=Capsaspora owczarzaki (strain ATCC 30864) TaxID=595528 RepID=A0A0D2U6S3_CAPO3|nr:hypothetical protein CAOG_02109 [Capsaspora owczarzaki ATCC 30864]KJE90871.1 hypothetical protein CAOG_002109 [Capsaspora owczarzaki ATCC 30864]|eukprot:XP_004348859.1 hypothetical protein CAOG_02109 [Capsaspora owczarzaki ATCC 30864]